MKKLLYILTAAAVVFTACAKEEYVHPTEAGAPKTASVYNPTVTVDQSVNQVTFTLGEKAVIPVWVFQDSAGEWSEYHARDGYQRIFAVAGDYTVRMFVMNSCGMTPDYVEKTFHIDNTIMNFDRYIRQISGGSEKVWRIDNSAEAHQACGESIANPAGWWAAKPDEKSGTGLYDNRLTFTSEGGYTFDPGDAGTVYVNTGVTVAPYGEFKEDADYTVPVSMQTTTYEFGVEGDALVLKLAPGTLFPYIPNNDYVTDTKFYVMSIDNNSMTLVWYTPTGNGGGPIAWQFILTSKAGAVTWNGFKYNAPSNIWLPADESHTTTQWYAPGWGQIADAQLEDKNGTYTLTYPEATTDQWQAQFFIIPTNPIALSSAVNYDFSVIISTSKELPGLTLKLTDTTDDGNFLFTERISVPAGGDCIFFMQDLPGIDAEAVKMVFDFGGNAADTEVSISHIVIKDHSVDDGTVPPGDEPVDPDTPGGNYSYGEELLGGLYLDSTWFSPADWSGGLDPQAKYEGGKLTLTVPEGVGGSEWQGQVKLVAQVPADPEKQYSFACKIESGADGTGTVKVADAAADAEHAFFYDNSVALKAFDTISYLNEPIAPDQAYEAVMVIFDFGRIPAGTEISVTGISLREITGESGGGGAAFDYNSDSNLWKPADAAHTYSQYYAPGWAQLPNPEITNIGNEYSFYCPTATSDQWQNQFFIIPNDPIALSAEKKYDFQCKVELGQDVKNVTFKLTDTTDDGNFLFTERRDITAYEEFTFTLTELDGIDAAAVKMVFDFGGNPDDTDVTIREIILREHE